MKQTSHPVAGGLAVGLFLAAAPWGAKAQTGGLLREVYLGISGTSVADLLNSPLYPDQPSLVEFIPEFEAPVEVDDEYGQRLRGYLLPPVTGSYRFWISSDDNSELYLSSDDSAAGKELIAWVPGWTNSREWGKYPEQESALVPLEAGHRYYIEALMKEGFGGDNLAVRWQLPGGAIETPIGENRVEPFGLDPPKIVQQPVSIQVDEGGEAVFLVRLGQPFLAAYRWQRDGADIAGATEQDYRFSPVTVADDQAGFRCIITNPVGAVTSEVATLTVITDTTAPAIQSATTLDSPNRITVTFTEDVEPATALDAGNYALSSGVSVYGVRFAGSPDAVVLDTGQLTPDVLYQLTISNVRDRAAVPNTILPGTTVGVTYTYIPLDIDLIRPRLEPLGPSRRRSGLVISEIMYNPAPRDDGLNTEFVEIYNTEEVSVDVSGYRLSGDVDFTIPAGTSLPSHQFLVVAPAPADVEAVYGISGVLGGFSDRLSNGGGVVRLRHRLNAVLCEVAFDDDPPWPVAADNGGHSLVLARPSYGEDDPRAWSASAEAGGSPGEAEPAAPTAYATVLINEILAHTDEPLVDYIELFNYGASPVDLGNCVLTDDPSTNRYVISPGVQIPAQGFLVFDQNELGFALSAAGETVYVKTPGGARVIDVVRFGPQAPATAWGRSPDGAPDFGELAAPTPGAANTPAWIRDVVINELMFNPPTGDDNDEFIELLHTGTTAIDLSGWRLRGGISYDFSPGTVMTPGGFLVVANDRLRLLATHPGLDGAIVVGDYSGALANGGETVRLEMPEDLVSIQNTVPVTNTVYIGVDEVTYSDGADWGAWADGGGSSLELIDPRADNRRPANWAGSDETAKSEWVTVEHAGVLDLGNGAIDEMQAMLLGAGECLVDDIEASSEGGANQVANGTFESGVEDWVIQGNHVRSGWSEAGAGSGGTRALHLRATSGGDNGANRVETDLSSPLQPGTTGLLRARARWLCGHPDLLLRLQGNYLEALGTLPIPADLGTPGMPNSRARANAGPAISDVTHSPVLPAAGEPVTILARVADPDGLSRLVVTYRLDPATDAQTVPMVYRGAGWFAAVLPGRPAGTLLAFRIKADDGAAPAMTSSFPPDPAGRECLVRFGDSTPIGGFGVYRLWMTQANVNTWATREKLSNEPIDTTFVLGNYRVVYNAGARYRGSPWIRPNYNSPVGNLCAYVVSFPKDDPVLGTDEFNLDTLEPDRDNTRQRERTSFWIAEQLGVPFTYQRYARILFNGAQRGEVYADSHQPNGDYIQTWFPGDDRGEIFKIDDWFEFNDSFGFSYFTARLEDYTTTGGVKKKARYRWSWEKKSNRGLDDDYGRLFALVDAVNETDPDVYPAAVASQADVEEWMRVFATRRIVCDWDGYSFERGKNQFAYKPENDRWKMLLWDMDFSLGGGSRSYTNGLFEGVEDPTISRMYGTPGLVRAYWRAMYDAVYGPLEAGRVGPVMDEWYSALQDNRVTPADPSGELAGWIAQRRSFILSQLATVASGFAVTSHGGADFSSSANLVTLSGTAPVQVRNVTVNGAAYPATWTTTTGWSIEVALGPGANLLEIGAVDSGGHIIAGLADTITVTYTGPAEDPADYLVINEIMYNSAGPDAAFIEIYNRSGLSTFDLGGYRLDGADFVFPAGTVIEPGAFVVVVNNLDAYSAAYGSSVGVAGVMNGKLDNGGETLRLVRPGETPEFDTLIDEVTYEDDPPWPAAADGFGPSLQLIDPDQDNNRVANWAASDASGSGGTNLVMDYGQVWRYQDQGIDLGTAWRATDFDDDDWKEGAGLIAVENASLPEPIRTVPTLGARTFYFRTTFSFAGNPAGAELWLESILDDGMIVYLNGAEVFRLGMTAGAVSYYTFASRAVVDAVREGPFSIPADALRTGENVLAVEVHQTGSGSSDVVLGLRMTAATPGGLPYTPGAPNQVTGGPPVLPPLWLNEVQAGNINGLRDAAGDADPWIELYNGGDEPLVLDGYSLSPDYGATRWPIPSGVVLGPGEFRVMWVDGEPGETTGAEYHTSFALPRYQGSISLVQDVDGGGVVDYLNYGALPDDRSYGAWPDGTPAHRRMFYYATPGASNTLAYPETPVVINEWMSANTSTLIDPADGDADDWIELVNLGPSPVDLSGYLLTDDLNDPDNWAFPSNTVIAANGFLVVWADDEAEQNQPGQARPHAGFRLSRDGEEIGLFTPAGEPVDTLAFTAQGDDQSSGRWPDGNADLTDLRPATPGAPNQVATNDNVAPVVGPLFDRFGYEESEIAYTIPATDANPGQELSFSMEPGAPAGATLNPQSGRFLWTPTEAQGPGQYSITVTATDDGTPPLSHSASFNAVVREWNDPPTLGALPDRELDEGSLLQFQAVATDSDLPLQNLSYVLLAGAPAGAAIDAVSGALTWTPSQGQGPGEYELTVVVTDDGAPPKNASATFTVIVDELGALHLFEAALTPSHTLRLNWVLDPSGPNQIQISDNVPASSWLPHPGPPGVSNVPPVEIPLTNVPFRIYRVVVPQP